MSRNSLLFKATGSLSGLDWHNTRIKIIKKSTSLCSNIKHKKKVYLLKLTISCNPLQLSVPKILIILPQYVALLCIPFSISNRDKTLPLISFTKADTFKNYFSLLEIDRF